MQKKDAVGMIPCILKKKGQTMNDIWLSIRKIVAGIAPTLGNAIMPGVGGIAGTLIAEVLGVDNEPEKISAALQNITPEQTIKIKELEYSHKEKWLTLAVEQDKAYLADVQSARNREIEIVKTTGKKDLNLYLLAWIIVIGFFCLCGILLFRQMPSGQNEIVYILFGGLAAGFGTVLNYFFGSSKGSNEKNTMLAARVK